MAAATAVSSDLHGPFNNIGTLQLSGDTNGWLSGEGRGGPSATPFPLVLMVLSDPIACPRTDPTGEAGHLLRLAALRHH
jgi:hypothetical protein